MKFKKNVIAGICAITLGLAASSSAMAGPGENPQLTPAEEGGFVLAESLISLTAAFVSRSGCGPVVGDYPYDIWVDETGSGSASYGAGSDPILLDVTPGPTMPYFGAHYDVASPVANDPGFLNAANSIQNFDGRLSYSEGGAILISNSDFEMQEFGYYVPWDEHNIKDFWLSDGTGQHISDSGLEAITKLTYPVTKWRQTSQHWRWNGGPGFFVAEKYLITPWNSADCHISISGLVNQLLGVFQLSGDVVVSDFD